ncbi:hypothetical protein C9J01_09340 [Photobacterium rosenbergii]|uniref:Uncharacterized protein n=1 Tax=Photobacterium rosenbergii TaxID=294936 RepID=A0A2T3NHX7_9GAMM|nr:hypothetical protein [Photobacterium rosenbergii]PSW14614.1 hypothetical protein C9J01_09340 [Photobacterium rosenbergii]
MSSGGITAAVLASNEPMGLNWGAFLLVLLVLLVGLLALYSPKIIVWSAKKAKYYKQKARRHRNDD